MANELVKRLVKKDGSQRISFYREDYADNPRFMTDEPLHCCDWSREYSIKIKKDPSYSDAQALITQMLVWYGKREVIIDMLVENGKHMTDGQSVCNNALVYDRSMRRWVLKEYSKWFGEKEYEWKDAEYFDGRKDEIDLGTLLESCFDSTIDNLCDSKYWTDKVKLMSYGFGYYGDISFYREFSTDSEGICWLEKDEFLKYSGCKEEYWNGKTLDEIEFLIKDLKAWADNEVYGFVVEKAFRVQHVKTYFNGEREDESYIETEWEEEDSCWGFYGEFDKIEDWMIEEAGLNKDGFEEVKVAI